MPAWRDGMSDVMYIEFNAELLDDMDNVPQNMPLNERHGIDGGLYWFLRNLKLIILKYDTI